MEEATNKNIQRQKFGQQIIRETVTRNKLCQSQIDKAAWNEGTFISVS